MSIFNTVSTITKLATTHPSKCLGVTTSTDPVFASDALPTFEAGEIEECVLLWNQTHNLLFISPTFYQQRYTEGYLGK